MAVVLIGSVCAGVGEWGVVAVYVVCLAAILVFFTAIYWIEDRPRR